MRSDRRQLAAVVVSSPTTPVVPNPSSTNPSPSGPIEDGRTADFGESNADRQCRLLGRVAAGPLRAPSRSFALLFQSPESGHLFSLADPAASALSFGGSAFRGREPASFAPSGKAKRQLTSHKLRSRTLRFSPHGRLELEALTPRQSARSIARIACGGFRARSRSLARATCRSMCSMRMRICSR